MAEKLQELTGLTYRGLKEIKGSLIMIEGIEDVGYDEIVRIRAPDGVERMGRVLEVGHGRAVIQVFGREIGLQINSIVGFSGSVFKIPLSEDILGRIFNGVGEPIDGAPKIISKDKYDINGMPINPVARIYPEEFIQTGISAIDGPLSLVRGQKLPIFSESGMPHNRIVAQIAKQATVRGKKEEFALVFAAIGQRSDEARFFIEQFKSTGALERSVVVMNLADDPAVERLFTPRIALTMAEYLAFDLGIHVLTILSDMTNYCEALREMSAAREEVPSRKGYPGYLYSDLASIYERAGKVKGRKGSLTQMPILTMPGGDLHHPIPDLTGYITEGQIFLDRDLFARGIYPPINVLPSLSRLMRSGIGEDKTREDHRSVADQLYYFYSMGMKARDLSRIVGEMSLSETEGRYLKFADAFERRFINQDENENRPIEKTLDIAWELLAMFPEDNLVRIEKKYIEKYGRRMRVNAPI
ncbi:MAG TPA: V-type ATP synthase subunit B [Candidatus Bathyarchaeia archaeon]|nr:MAG: V-type ATP synthase subunit B [Candidatus Bathyarchaeota archaeon RBG_16_48_13]HJX22799.1 V-type ATP synthase subunit B [Candidatus Bathyarchaeia archaeon]